MAFGLIRGDPGGGRGHTLASAAVSLVLQALGTEGREVSVEDQVALLRLFDSALAASFAKLSEQQRAEAFDCTSSRVDLQHAEPGQRRHLRHGEGGARPLLWAVRWLSRRAPR